MKTVSWPIKLIYGTGQAAESIKNFGFGTLLLLYYNQVLGLSGTYSGIAVFIAVACDAVTDPAVGSWSDGFRHRLGRRHLFMLGSALPLGITYFCLFWPPEGLSEFGLFVWFTVFAVLSRTALTFFHVPYLALGAEMSPDYQERTQITAVRMAIGMAASLLVILIAWNFFFVATPDSPSPQLTRSPYFNYALISALIMAALMSVSTWGTLSLVPKLAGSSQAHAPFNLKRVYTDIYEALQNRSFFALFLGSLVFAVFMGVHSALSMHTKTFFWELDTTGIQFVQYAGVIGGLCGIVVIGWFHRVFDKRLTLIVGVIAFAVSATLPVFLELFGWMTSDKDLLLVILIGAQLVGYGGIIHAHVSGMSMMGDIADEHELVHGRRQEGVYFGSHNFAIKCTQAVGNLVAGFALDLVNFPVNSTPGQVPEQVLFDYGLFSVVLVFMAVIGLWIFWPYDMSEERHREIRKSLDDQALGRGAQT